MTFLAGQELDAVQLEKMANLPRCRAVATVAQSIPNNTWTAISFPAEDFKYNIGHDTVTNPTFFSCQVAGLYRLSGGACWDTSGTGVRALKWQKNGVDIAASGSSMLGYSSGQPILCARTIEVQLAVTDYVMLMTSQNSGGALNTYVAVDYAKSHMSICLIRDDSL